MRLQLVIMRASLTVLFGSIFFIGQKESFLRGYFGSKVVADRLESILPTMGVL